MPLTWNAEGVKDYNVLAEDTVEESKTAYLCFEMMRCGFGPTITEKNVQKLWKRVNIAQKVWGAILVDGDGNYVPYTEEDLVRRIGYRSNSSMHTDSQFAKRLMD